MSKNKQMRPDFINTVGAEHATAGPACLVQGAYGSCGNLELVACDATDGLWVFWFNADDADAPLQAPDVPPGQWSTGLAFAAGRRYVDAQIVQSTFGPNHLEVVALTDDGTLESWYWSPGPGFQRRDCEVATAVRRFLLEHHDGILRVVIDRHDGVAAVATSGVDEYPDRVWREAPLEEFPDDDRAARMLSARGIVDVLDGTARRASSTRDGGMIEFTWRDTQGRIRHLARATT